MTSAKSLATRFYQLKCGHASIGAYLKQFGPREDYKCWWCGGMVGETREHLIHQCSRWKYQQRGPRVVGGSSAISPARPEAEGIRACHTLASVNMVWINNNNNSDTTSLHNNHLLRAITMNQPATASMHHHEKPNHTKCSEQKRTNEEAQLSVDPKRRKIYRLIYEREWRKTQCRLPKPEPNAKYQCRGILLDIEAGEAGGGRRGQWGP